MAHGQPGGLPRPLEDDPRVHLLPLVTDVTVEWVDRYGTAHLRALYPFTRSLGPKGQTGSASSAA